MSLTEKRQRAVQTRSRLPLMERCKLMGINRSGVYYKPKITSALNEQLMRTIDQCFMAHPYYGVARMTTYLKEDLGYQINEKRVRKTISSNASKNHLCQAQTTLRDKANCHYPYLLADSK
ncbi:MAG: IS3 family transposase [Bacteroidia bacterium]